MVSRRPDILANDVVNLYKSGKNYREIAKYFNTDSKIIISRLEKAGIHVEKLTTELRQDLDNSKIKELYSGGVSSEKIAKLVGCTDVTVCNRLKRMGIIFPKIDRDDIDLDDVIHMYNIEKKSAREIGKKYNASHTLIYRKLEQAGYNRRSQKEALEKYARINECVVCGEKFRPKAKWTDTNGLNRKTCSKLCHSALMSSLTSDEKSHNWKGRASQPHYQRIAKILKPTTTCEICNEEIVTERKDTHHMDRDHTNNTSDNLHIWCVKCHAKYHYITDDRGLRGWNPNTPKLKEFKNKLDELGIPYTIHAYF
jgi:hypothetical protein